MNYDVLIAFVTWLIVNAYGINNVTIVASSDPANFWFNQSTKHLGEYATILMRFLLLTSIFASLLAFHHTLARYFYAMSREGVLPKLFSKTHPVFQSPHNASYLQTITAGLGITLFVMTKADPYEIMFTWMSALGLNIRM